MKYSSSRIIHQSCLNYNSDFEIILFMSSRGNGNTGGKYRQH